MEERLAQTEAESFPDVCNLRRVPSHCQPEEISIGYPGPASRYDVQKDVVCGVLEYSFRIGACGEVEKLNSGIVEACARVAPVRVQVESAVGTVKPAAGGIAS